METKYRKLQPFKLRLGLMWLSYVGILIYALTDSGGAYVGITLFVILGLSLFLLLMYLLIIRMYGFYPILYQECLRIRNVKFSKCDKDFNYSDIQRAEVITRYTKLLGNLMVLWIIFKDGSKQRIGLITHLKLKDELCNDLRIKGIMVD